MDKKKNIESQTKLWSVVNNVFIYENTKGHLKWKISDIARTSGIARTSIYYHFGNTKREIFDRCFTMIAESFYGKGENVSRRKNLAKGVWASKQIMDKNPSIMAFMYRWRQTNSPLQVRLIQLEKEFQNRILDETPALEKHQVLAIHSMFHGITTSAFLDEKGLSSVVDLIQRIQSGRIRMI